MVGFFLIWASSSFVTASTLRFVLNVVWVFRWSGPAAPVVPKELREKAVLGANILKDGSDPSILADRSFSYLS